MIVDIQWDELPYENVRENVVATTNVAFRLFLKDVKQEAQDNIAPDRSGLHNRSGNLRDSIRITNYYQFKPSSGGSATITAGNAKVPYSTIHEYGGVIRPRTAPYLAFQVNGQWVRKKQVTIPARPYLRPAVETKASDFDSYLQASIDRISGRL